MQKQSQFGIMWSKHCQYFADIDTLFEQLIEGLRDSVGIAVATIARAQQLKNGHRQFSYDSFPAKPNFCFSEPR